MVGIRPKVQWEAGGFSSLNCATVLMPGAEFDAGQEHENGN